MYIQKLRGGIAMEKPEKWKKEDSSDIIYRQEQGEEILIERKCLADIEEHTANRLKTYMHILCEKQQEETEDKQEK